MEELVIDNINLIYFALKQLKLYNANGIEEYFDVGMLGLVKGAKTYTKDKGKPSTYLMRCIKNEILVEIRSGNASKRGNGQKTISLYTKTADNLTLEDNIKSEFDMLDYLIKKEQIQTLYKALNNLEEKDKDIIMDFYFKGKTQQDIKKKNGISQSAVSKKKANAIKKLKAQFEKL